MEHSNSSSMLSSGSSCKHENNLSGAQSECRSLNDVDEFLELAQSSQSSNTIKNDCTDKSLSHSDYSLMLESTGKTKSPSSGSIDDLHDQSESESQELSEDEGMETDDPDVSTMDRIAFLGYQKKLLNLERDAETERETMKTLSSTGEGKPGVLPHLEVLSSVTSRFGRINVTLSSYTRNNLPSHVLRKGDNVSLYTGGVLCRDEDHITDGVLLEVSITQVVVTIDENYAFTDTETYSLKHYPSIENIRRLLKGLRDIEDHQGPGYQLAKVLFRERAPKTPMPRLPPKLCLQDTDTLDLFNKHLDASQKAAVEFVLKQHDLAVVHGPPGTGKTTTLIEIIRQHVKLGVKILVMAPSNLGVDNLVERLDDVGLSVLRIGHPARTTPATQRHTIDALLHTCDGRQVIDDIQVDIQNTSNKLSYAKRCDRRDIHKDLGKLRKELYERQDRLTRDLIRGADVVLCTLLSAHPNGALRHLKTHHFGLTVIDECSQGTEPSCYLGVMRSPKLVMAGDHKQLPPTVLCPEASYLLTSLMERVISTYGNMVMRLLTVQYRMHEDIMKWASDTMYGGQLTAHSSVKGHLLKDLPAVQDNEQTDIPLLLVDTSNCAGFQESEDAVSSGQVCSKSNEGEASLVLALVKRMLDSGLKQDQVAVITPYSRQVKLVKTLVCTDFPDVEVQTVDGFQGREKEAVVLTLVRSNDKGEIGFLAEDRRLNVAVTRAKRHLSVVCNTRTLQQHVFLKNFVDYMMANARVVRAEDMDEENCIKISVDYSQIDLSDILTPPKKETVKEVKSEEQLAKEEEAIKQLKIKRYKKILDKFVAGSNHKHRFPSKLSSFDRMLIHDMAESIGLHHYSEGIEAKRHVVLSKESRKEVQVEEMEDDIDEDMESSDEASDSAAPIVKETPSMATQAVKNKPPNNLTKSAEAITKHCTLCGKNIPTGNFTIHHLACEKKEKELIAIQKKKLAAKQLEVEIHAAEELASKSKKKKKPQKSKATCDDNDADDFDTVVSSFTAMNSRCGLVCCRNKTLALLLQTCRWCHTMYCLEHFIAEAHGCGHHAKQDARATVVREGVLYPGSGVPSKMPHPDKRAQMHRKLDKKLASMEQDRKKQHKKK